jgi:hypothetical protein
MVDGGNYVGMRAWQSTDKGEDIMPLWRNMAETGFESAYKMAAEALLKSVAKGCMPSEEYECLVRHINTIKEYQWKNSGPEKLQNMIGMMKKYFTRKDEEECHKGVGLILRVHSSPKLV